MKLDVKELIAKITNTPMVVESGTSGIWTYRKWSNGIAECWGVWDGTLSHYVTFAGWYGYSKAIGLPTSLFISTPICTYSAYVGNSFGLTGTVTTNTTSNISCFAVANCSGSQTVRFYMRVIGKWK